MNPPRPRPSIRLKCKACGSRNVRATGFAAWDGPGRTPGHVRLVCRDCHHAWWSTATLALKAYREALEAAGQQRLPTEGVKP